VKIKFGQFEETKLGLNWTKKNWN